MVESLNGVVAPKCKLCGERHWTTEPEKCGLYTKPEKVAFAAQSIETQAKNGSKIAEKSSVDEKAPGIAKHGVETKSNPELAVCSEKKKAGKNKGRGRPQKRVLTPKAQLIGRKHAAKPA